ncbi:hypothetical protein [Lapidilactobacillus salsurivasis]
MIRVDSKVYQVLALIYKLLVVNFLLIVFSLPLVTAGAALIAALAVLQDEQPRGYVRRFIQTFRANLLSSWSLVLFGIISVLFIQSLNHYAGDFGRLYWFLKLGLTSFLICYNLNVAMIKNDPQNRTVFQLFRDSFVFTIVALMKQILYPMVALVGAWLIAKYLGEFTVVILLALCLAGFERLSRSSLQSFLKQIAY